MKTKHSGLIMGPAAAPQAPTATKFWNMASTGDDEGEITLYGDVMSQQPVDWWTGEPEPGLFITPEGFMSGIRYRYERSWYCHCYEGVWHSDQEHFKGKK